MADAFLFFGYSDGDSQLIKHLKFNNSIPLR